MLLLSTSLTCQAASFCFGHLNVQERLICDNDSLSRLDDRLNGVFWVAKSIATPMDKVLSSQRVWLRDVRGKCINDSCLFAAYQGRIDELIHFVGRHGPLLPPEIAAEVHHAADGYYCKTSGAAPENGDWFSLALHVHGEKAVGVIDGIFNCGQHIWGPIDIEGTVIGNAALVHFEARGSGDHVQKVEALVAVDSKRVYWRILSQIEVENAEERFVSIQETLPLVHIPTSGN